MTAEGDGAVDRTGRAGRVQQRPEQVEALWADGITVRYGALTALEDVSWSVRTGEILGLIGPNGAGKSTNFAGVTNSVAHLGEVHLFGKAVTGLPTQKLARLGLRRTYQQNSFFGHLSVLDNAMTVIQAERGTALTASLLTPWREAARRRACREEAAALLRRFGIDERHFDVYPDEMPYGLQRVFAIALAYGTGVRVLLLDEPAAGVGGDEMRALVALLSRLRDEGLAIVLIEHHMDLLMEVADRVVVLDGGRVLATGSPGTIQRDPRVLEAYLGQAA